MADPIGTGSTPTVWFDASDLTTVHATSGAVDTWDDKSGGGLNATAATTARPTTGTRSLNGRNVLDFDGVANIMKTATNTIAAPYTFGAVFLNDVGGDATAHRVFGDVTNNRGFQTTAGNQYQVSTGNTPTAGTVDHAAHSWVSVGASVTVTTILIDGILILTGGNSGTGSTAGGYAIGAKGDSTTFWNGIIAEVILYPSALTVSQQVQLANYFSTKWFVRSIAPMREVLLAPATPALLPTERLIRPAVVATTGSTGTLATTNTNDTLAASGTTTVTGSLARTNANDTLAAAGSGAPVSGTLATTNANDTLSAAGTTTVTGALAKTNNNDTSVAAGTTKILGTSATTNANDTLAAAGTGNTNFVPTAPAAPTVGGTLSGRRGPYLSVDAELEAILRDDEEILVLL